MQFEEAIHYAVTGDATLFCGAGFSVGARSTAQSEMQVATDLASAIAAEVDVEETDIEEATDLYLSMRTGADLCEFLVPRFSCSKPAAHHVQVASVPWRRIYTTNYDDVIEQAAKLADKHVHATCLSDDPQEIRTTAKMCLHVNGYIGRLSEETLNNEFKLSSRSNLTASFRDSPWATLFLSDLRNSKTVFVIGYSLKHDLDLKRLMMKSPGLTAKTFFIVAPNEPDHNRRRMEEFGQVIPTGVKDFAARLSAAHANYQPPDEFAPTFESFTRTERSTALPTAVRDEHIFSLLIKGQLRTDVLRSSTDDPETPRYIVHRSVHDEVIEEIRDLGRRTVVIHADLGNGKTVLVEHLKLSLSALGYEVFWFDEFGEAWEDEVEAICALSTDTAIVIEGYADKNRLLEQIALHRHRSVVLILTERSVVSDATTIRLPDEPAEIAVFDVNYLHDDDVSRVVTYFNHFGLWGTHQRKSVRAKRAIIERECHRNLQTILLDIVYSDDIQNRFAVLFNAIRTSDRRLLRPMLLALLSRALNTNLRVEHIAALTDFSDFNTAQFRNDPAVQEIFDLDGDELRVKSAVLAMSLLRRLQKLKRVFAMLRDICVRANRYRTVEPYRQLLKRLNSFSDLRHALPERPDFYTEMVNYYEELKNLDFYQRNPHFWLQYAIARLHYRQFDIARRYFDNAYSLALGNPVVTSFIDNHYARFLLESQIANPDEKNPIGSFEDAHKLLMRGSEYQRSWDYVFKVATNYLPFYNSFFDGMSDDEKALFLNGCEEMKRNLDTFKKRASRYHLNSRHNVFTCERAIDQILHGSTNRTT